MLPSVVSPVGACLAGTQAPPALSRLSPSHPASAYCFSTELTGSSLGSQIKYLKDVKNLSWFLWQQENNSHFPGKLKENRFSFALWVAVIFMLGQGGCPWVPIPISIPRQRHRPGEDSGPRR